MYYIKKSIYLMKGFISHFISTIENQNIIIIFFTHILLCMYRENNIVKSFT